MRRVDVSSEIERRARALVMDAKGHGGDLWEHLSPSTLEALIRGVTYDLMDQADRAVGGEAPDASAAGQPEARDIPARFRILLIDDHAPFRTMARLMLEGAGYEVEEATNGATGMTRYRQSPPDLVITDILMPVMEGLETIIALRGLDPQVKIIAMTGGDDARGVYLSSAQMFGAVRTIRKPFSETELLAAVAEALGA
jgi:two-component system response regulator (stage 0 sporulation protein F)